MHCAWVLLLLLLQQSLSWYSTYAQLAGKCITSISFSISFIAGARHRSLHFSGTHLCSAPTDSGPVGALLWLHRENRLHNIRGEFPDFLLFLHLVYCLFHKLTRPHTHSLDFLHTLRQEIRHQQEDNKKKSRKQKNHLQTLLQKISCAHVGLFESVLCAILK